jgi:hypothetical protein
MNNRRLAALCLAFLSIATVRLFADAGEKSLIVANETKARVAIIERTKLKRGEAIQGRLLEPIYVDNRLAIPAGARLDGNIVSIRPAPRAKRLDAKSHGDFTPLGEPVIEFSGLSLRDGEHYPVSAEVNGGAGTTLYFSSATAKQKSIFQRAKDAVVGKKNSAISTVTAPGKLDRLKSWFWSQMPYHPQSVQEGKQYEASFAKDLKVPARSESAELADISEQKPLDKRVTIQSRLETRLDSATAKQGDTVEALVTQPVFDDKNQLLIPQGSKLHGKVLEASPAGRWGHNGLVRFSFSEISLPSGFHQKVQGVPTAIAGDPNAKLTVDQEGGVTAETNHSVMAPLVMGLLAASSLSADENTFGNTAISSNGFAFIGRALALATTSRYVGGTIGAIGTSRTVYTRWLAHGKEMHFDSDTEIQLQVSPEQAHRMELQP